MDARDRGLRTHARVVIVGGGVMRIAHPGTTLEVELLGERRPAIVLASAAHDPENERLRA